MCNKNNRELITKEKKCPKCGSENIESCGTGRSNPIAGIGSLPKVIKWQYQCLDCKKRFYILD